MFRRNDAVPETLYIKNMVCDRCIAAVRDALRRCGVEPVSVALGEALLPQPCGGTLRTAIRRELEARLEREGIAPLLEELRQVDPESAERLHPADTKRILRALEVYRETGSTISAHNAATRMIPPRYDAVWIGLQFADRADMKALIDCRVDKMVQEGLLDEVRALLAMGLPRTATAMQAIGYKEFLGVLDGALTEPEAIELVKLRSRQYAKRQLTWLRRNPDIHWIFWEKDRDFARALQISTEILSASGLG